MMRRSWARNAFVLWISLFAVCAVGFGAAGTRQPSSDPMAVIPAESLFCVRISSLNATLAKVDQFLTGVFPVSVSQLAPMQLAQFLGGPEVKGINMNGSFAAFGPLPGGAQAGVSRIGVLVPVTDYQLFVEGNPKVTPPDAQGISQIGEGEQGFVAARAGDYALVTTAGNRQALMETKNLLAGPGTTPLIKRLAPEELKQATDSPVWAYVNMQAAAKILDPMIQRMLQQTREGLEGTATPRLPVPAPMPAQPEALMETYARALSAWMNQTQSVSLSLDPSAAALRADLVMAAMPETEMAKILSMDSSLQQQPNLLRYLENGAVMNGVAMLSPTFLKALTTKYIDLLSAAAGNVVSKEDIGRFRQLAMDSTDALAGPIAFSVSVDVKSKPPFRAKYVAVLQDKQKFSQFLDQMPRMMNEGAIANLNKAFGLKMQLDLKRNASTYKDIPIDAIRITMQPVDANAPEGQMMKMMFGEGFDLRLAIVDNFLVYALSAAPEKEIQSLIDQVKAGGAGPLASEVQTAMELLPEAKNAEFFMTYNYLRAMQIATAMMPIPIAPTDVPTQSSIAIAGEIRNGKLQISAAVPKQHVIETMTVFMKMQQQQPQKPQQPEQEQQSAPTTPSQQDAKAGTDGWSVAGGNSVFSPQAATQDSGIAVGAIPSGFLGTWVAPDGSDYEIKRVVIGKDEIQYGATRVKAGECRTTDDGATLVFKIRMVNPDIATSAGPYVDRVDVRLTVSGGKLTVQSGGRMEQSIGDGWTPVVATKVRTYSREPGSPQRQ